jgi:suppressor of ftsI
MNINDDLATVKRATRVLRRTVLYCIVSIFLLAASLCAQEITEAVQAHSPVKLTAVRDLNSGRMTFSYAGQNVAPEIHVSPGRTLRVDYENRLPVHSDEECVVMPCMDMTNLHFHGLHVSPNRPQDDVLTMMAMPGESLHYEVVIPKETPPGMYWYHTHPHGESYRQSLDGMSGALIIDGISRYLPELASMRERILVLRSEELKEHSAATQSTLSRVTSKATGCGGGTEAAERVFTVNGQLRPTITIARGERQFWRIANASPDLYADIQIDGGSLEVVALDGMPLAYHDPQHPTRKLDHVLLSPAGRLEAIVTGPTQGAPVSLRSLCVDTGPDGDPNPDMVLADLRIEKSSQSVRPATRDDQKPIYKQVPPKQIVELENQAPEQAIVFTEDKMGFYINGKKFSMDDAPMLSVKVGDYQHWRVVNNSKELHPFHIHQVHFLAYEENGKRIASPEWLDTVNVPYGGSVDLIMDFTDPIIRGISVFHCHLLKHEDKGMMAKILFR